MAKIAGLSLVLVGMDRLTLERAWLAGRSPAILTTAVAASGLWIGMKDVFLPISLCMLLLALGIMLGRARGSLLVVAGAAMVLGVLDQRDAFPEVPSFKPVIAVGTINSHPVVQREMVRFDLEVRLLRHRQQIWTGSKTLLLTIPRSELDVGAGIDFQIGQEVRGKGYLLRDSAYQNGKYARPDVNRLSFRVKSVRLLHLMQSAPAGYRALTSLRRLVEGLLSREIDDSRARGLARALVTGDRSELDDDWVRQFRRFGLVHLLAVSGLHFGILSGVTLLILIRAPASIRMVVSIVVLCGYLGLVGPRDSASRAALMILCGFLAICQHRPANAANALATSVLLILAFDPSALARLGLRLSVTATAGVLLALSIKASPRALGLIIVSLAAQVVSAPQIVPITGAIHPLAPLLNLLAIPWLTVVLVTSLAITFMASLELDTWIAVSLLELLTWPLQMLETVPASRLFMSNVSFWLPPTLALLLSMIAKGIKSWRIGLLAVLILFCPASERVGANDLELIMLDVGQGDAIVLRDGPRVILIDGGGWRTGDFASRVLFPALASLGITHLDLAVLTHPDSDHCQGLAQLSQYLSIRELWTPRAWKSANCFEQLKSNVPRWELATFGFRSEVGRWKLEALYPPRKLPRSVDRNNQSLVLVAEGEGIRVLLTGDLEADGERLLQSTPGLDLRADILKVGHHGSKGASTGSFLARVSPRIALVSAGRGNLYGHPHPETLERIAQVGSRVLRTDHLGMIRIRVASRSGHPLELSFTGIEAK